MSIFHRPVFRNRRVFWLTATTLTALSAIAAALLSLGTSQAASNPQAAPPATRVSVATVVQSNVATWNEFSGRLEAVERVDIRPRVAGTVQSVHFREGALVKVSPIYASFDADEQVVTRALRSLPSGAGARSQLERIPVQMGTANGTDTPFEGRLQLVDNQVDAKSGTVRVRAVFDNKDGSLMPGQFARLRLGQATTAPALLVNERAVGTDQNKKFVMVVDADNKANYREVTLGANVNGLRIVTAGLKPSERIVVNGLQRVRPGALVAPEPVAMDAKTELHAKPVLSQVEGRDGAAQS